MDNKDHKKKMIAPVIITIVFIVYLVAYSLRFPWWLWGSVWYMY